MKATTLVLPPRPDSVPAARRFVTRLLSRSPARRHCDDAALLVGELVSNAVLHAGTAIELNVDVQAHGVRIEVHDHSPHLPQTVSGAGETMAGRGLHIVDGIAQRWGAEPVHTGGKKVWFELAP